MKRCVSLILAAVMLLTMAMPVFALTSAVDAAGLTIYVNGYEETNREPKPLSEAPKMDYIKKIEDITFSNYIRHTERDSKDYSGNPIKVYQVYVGLDASMRSDLDKTEFMLWTNQNFNYINPSIEVCYNKTPLVNSDFNSIKTNTPMLLSSSLKLNAKRWLDNHSIDAYAAKSRNMDGTWDGGLQWTFHMDPDDVSPTGGAYKKAHVIRVNQGNKATYFQVFVTDGTNYSGDRNYKEPTNPVIPAIPAENVTAVPNKSAVYINNVLTEFEAYTINENNYFKLRDVALVLRGTEKQFNVTWNGAAGAIDMESNKGYIPVGGEMSLGNGLAKQGILNKSKLLKDGREVDVTGYTINQNNFFKLRDLGELFDFNVTWNGKLNAIEINTAESYDPNN